MSLEERAQEFLEENKDEEVVVEVKGDRPTAVEIMRAMGFTAAADEMERLDS